MMSSLVDRVIEYADKKKNERLLQACGGIQKCPYCLQVMQSGVGCSQSEHPNDPMVDVLQCGVCWGKSIWRFEIGYFYVGPYEAPKAKHKTWSYNETLHSPQTT